MQYLRQTIDPLAVKIFTPNPTLRPLPLLHLLFLGTGAGSRKIHPLLGVTQPPHKKEIAAVQAAEWTAGALVS